MATMAPPPRPLDSVPAIGVPMVYNYPPPFDTTPVGHPHPPMPPTPVLMIDAGAGDTQTTFRQLQLTMVVDPPPTNWGCIHAQDADFCLEVLKLLVSVHERINDGVFETLVVPRAVEFGGRPGTTEPQVAYYELCAFGLKKPVTLEDMISLKNYHRRVLQVGYNPCAQSQNQKHTGALIVVVSTRAYDSSRELADRTTPIANGHSPAIKRRKSEDEEEKKAPAGKGLLTLIGETVKELW
jgi:hypothetical protein